MIRFVTALLIAFALQPTLSVFAEKDESTKEETKVKRMTQNCYGNWAASAMPRSRMTVNSWPTR